jgi:V/A-type H+-transporting ATPase subunit I
MISQGGFMIVGAVILLAIGHVMNAVLGVLGSFLQSMRLHYVEFFQKFYEGGGYYYSPFGIVKKQ